MTNSITPKTQIVSQDLAPYIEHGSLEAKGGDRVINKEGCKIDGTSETLEISIQLKVMDVYPVTGTSNIRVIRRGTT